MLNKNIINIISTIFIIFVLTGCSVKEFDLEKLMKPVKKEFVYERPAVDAALLDSIKNIIKAMSKNDIALINNQYINPNFGLYNLYKIDGIKTFSYQKLIYNVVEGEIEEFSHLISRVKSKQTLLPILQEDTYFKCSPNDDKYYGWDKEGLYLNAHTKTYLSEYMTTTNMFQKDNYKKEDLHKAKVIEKMAYKVVLTPEIIFYMSKIDKKWYITLIDRITTDCSSKKDN